ncbi:MAG TPA: carbon-nitrogen hydrolase family protein [Sphingobacteriaceae bacterium]
MIRDKSYSVKVIFTIILLMVLKTSSVTGAGHVRIGTIGTAAPSFSGRKDMQKVVEEMILFWGNQLKQVLPDKPDVILLPEFFDIPSGFSSKVQEEYIAIRGDQLQTYLSSIAKKHNCYVAYGTLRRDHAGNLRNSAIMLDRRGDLLGIYDKNFPTIGEMESGIIAGNKAPVFECDFGRVAMVICFDLNFDELLEQVADQKPDLLLFPSMYHGGQMQSNWAYACRSFFVGAISGKGTLSQIRDPLGEVVASTTNYFNYSVASINLNSELVHLGYNFGKLSALKAKYGNSVTIKDPGNLGPVLVSSEDGNLNINQLLREFDIQTLDDYFDSSRKFRLKRGNMN